MSGKVECDEKKWQMQLDYQYSGNVSSDNFRLNIFPFEKYSWSLRHPVIFCLVHSCVDKDWRPSSYHSSHFSPLSACTSHYSQLPGVGV